MMVCLACSRVSKHHLCAQATFSLPQKLSIGELSQQLPLRLMDERIPHLAKAAWKSWLQYCASGTVHLDDLKGGLLWGYAVSYWSREYGCLGVEKILFIASKGACEMGL